MTLLEKCKKTGKRVLKRIPVLGPKVQALKNSMRTTESLVNRMDAARKEIEALKEKNRELEARIAAVSPALADAARRRRLCTLQETSFFQAYLSGRTADLRNRLKSVQTVMEEILHRQRELPGRTVSVLNLGTDFGFWEEAGNRTQAEPVVTNVSGMQEEVPESSGETDRLRSDVRAYLRGCAGSSRQIVSSFFCLDQLEPGDIWECLQEISRILTPSGQVLILRNPMSGLSQTESLIFSACGRIPEDLFEAMLTGAGLTDVTTRRMEGDTIQLVTARKS